MDLFKMKFAIALAPLAMAMMASAAQLSTDARGAVPHETQQLVVIDYRAMQNSRTAMQLRNHLMPPDLKQFDLALRNSGLNDNHDVDQLAFALFRAGGTIKMVGIAQGQFDVAKVLANFRQQKVKPTLVRSNKIYPMAHAGMVLCFVDPSTMVFGQKDAVTKTLDARDGISQSLLSNGPMMDAMRSVDSEPLWSILDAKGTRTMMKQVMGEAGSLTDYDSVQKRLESSWYSMSFQHGVKFDLTIQTGDTFAAATVSSLMNAALLVRRMSGSDAEKSALNATSVSSSAGKLLLKFAASDSEFANLLQSSLFKSVVR